LFIFTIMKKTILLSLHILGRILRWRWLALISGVALIAACSGKADKNKINTDTVNDTERVTCYEPMVIENSTDTVSMERKQEKSVADTGTAVSVLQK